MKLYGQEDILFCENTTQIGTKTLEKSNYLFYSNDSIGCTGISVNILKGTVNICYSRFTNLKASLPHTNEVKSCYTVVK